MSAAPALQPCQDLLIGVPDPVSDVGQQHLPGQRRRRAHPQNRRQRMADSLWLSRISDRGETLHHTATTHPMQHRRTLQHDRHRRLTG